MSRYLIETSHTPRECVWALKQLLHHRPDAVPEFEWGCHDGVHTGWSVVEAEHRFAAMDVVPRVLRPNTRIVQLNQFTEDEIMAFHEGQLVGSQ
jgi:hypothetical protein